MVSLQTDIDGDLEQFDEFSAHDADATREAAVPIVRDAIESDSTSSEFTILRNGGIVDESLANVASGDLVLYKPSDVEQFANDAGIDASALTQYLNAGYSIGVQVE